jgi:hypothetical protein
MHRPPSLLPPLIPTTTVHLHPPVSTPSLLKNPPTLKKMVEPISKRKLAWETTEEEGKTTIGVQHMHFQQSEYKTATEGAREDQKVDRTKHGFLKVMSENSKKLMPILVSMSSKEDASMSKQTYVASGLNAHERALAEMPTQQVVQVLDFMEQIRMPLSVALGHEEPPQDPSFEYRWPFQIRKPLILPELVLKLSPKMYKFHEWYMWQSTKGVRSIGMLARPEDFATEGNKVVSLKFRDIYEVYHLDALNADLIVALCL